MDPHLHLMDLSDQSTWPDRCLVFVDRVRSELDAQSNMWTTTSPYDLGYELSHVDRQFEIETEFRSVILAGVGVVLSHFTRLLPEQRDAISRCGMTPLSPQDHADRQRSASQSLGIDAEAALHRGASWYEARGEQLWGVAPMLPAAKAGGDGLTCFLTQYGGEVTYFGRGPYAELDELTARSHPCIVQIAVPPCDLNAYTHIWKVAVAQRAGRPDAWHEWFTNHPVPANRIVRFLDEQSHDWPYRQGLV